jgi:steroid delta-isomerase-like uncharacterized protein
MSAENKALVRRWFEEVWNQGSTAAIDELFARDGVAHGFAPDACGRDQFKQVHALYRAAFPDVRILVEDVVAEGDMAAVRWSATGTHRGDLLGFSGTGKQARFNGMSLVRLKGGQIVEGWNVFDQLGMLQQLGAIELGTAAQSAS